MSASTHSEESKDPGAASIGPRKGPLERRSIRFIRGFTRWSRPWLWLWYRPTVTGLDRIPRGPALFVGNHNGCGAGESLVLLDLWTRRHGTSRLAHALAHDLIFRVPLIGTMLAKVGGIPAHRVNAKAAFESGADLLVFPGGDEEALRPFSQRSQVQFHGRTGFVTSAVDNQVPIVPFVISGSHAQYCFLPGGPATARALKLVTAGRLKALPTWPMLWVALTALVASVAGWLPWWAFCVAWTLAFVPTPTQIHIDFLPAVAPGTLQAMTPEAAAEEVRRLMAAQLEKAEAARWTPWGGRRHSRSPDVRGL